jgi:hypothetical protein
MFELIIDDSCTDMLNASLVRLSFIVNHGISLVYGCRHGSCPYGVGIATTLAHLHWMRCLLLGRAERDVFGHHLREG